MSTLPAPIDKLVVIDQASAYLASSGAADLDTTTRGPRSEACTSAGGIYTVTIPEAE